MAVASCTIHMLSFVLAQVPVPQRIWEMMVLPVVVVVVGDVVVGSLSHFPSPLQRVEPVVARALVTLLSSVGSRSSRQVGL